MKLTQLHINTRKRSQNKQIQAIAYKYIQIQTALCKYTRIHKMQASTDKYTQKHITISTDRRVRILWSFLQSHIFLFSYVISYIAEEFEGGLLCPRAN